MDFLKQALWHVTPSQRTTDFRAMTQNDKENQQISLSDVCQTNGKKINRNLYNPSTIFIRQLSD